jgi:hypothetical protein
MTVQENIEKLKEALDKLNEHPMCLKYKLYNDHVVVIFPTEVHGVHGFRAKGKTRTIAVENALQQCEQFWKLDNPILYPPHS